MRNAIDNNDTAKSLQTKSCSHSTSSDELSQIWAMGDKSFHVVDNLHGVLAAAAPKLAPPQLDHLLLLVQEV